MCMHTVLLRGTLISYNVLSQGMFKSCEDCEDDIRAIFLFVKAARACQVGHMELSGLQRDGEICALCTTKEGNIF
jgi:hypothetical protein